MGAKNPRVTIGMPVFNGEIYVLQALESIVDQTYTDFELIISDNASTDGTERICRAYAARDPRIRYYRNESNLGAVANFNRVFEFARGEYFKWAAHDDVLAPTYLEKTVAALDADPGAVLCQSLVRIIDEKGKELAIYDSNLRGTDSPRASDRFAPVILIYHICAEILGLIRADAMRRTALHARYHGGDRALQAELSLLGRFMQIREPLFMQREHAGRGSRATRAADPSFYEGKQVRRTALFYGLLYRDYLRAVRKHVPYLRERMRCYWHLLRWWGRNWNLMRMAANMMLVVFPGMLVFVEKAKNKLTRPHILSDTADPQEAPEKRAF